MSLPIPGAGSTFIIPPGASLFLTPFSDAVYGYPTGPASSICFMNS